MTRVSSLSSAWRSVDSPSANAAQIKARFVMLLEPGGRMRARGGDATGWMARESIMNDE
jgi:hypothetical protein